MPQLFLLLLSLSRVSCACFSLGHFRFFALALRPQTFFVRYNVFGKQFAAKFLCPQSSSKLLEKYVTISVSVAWGSPGPGPGTGREKSDAADGKGPASPGIRTPYPTVMQRTRQG